MEDIKRSNREKKRDVKRLLENILDMKESSKQTSPDNETSMKHPGKAMDGKSTSDGIPEPLDRPNPHLFAYNRRAF